MIEPLIVLVGWLGSRPRHLNKYETLYKRAGFRVLTRVASPSQVVTATLRLPHLQIPHRWPDLTLEKNSCSIQDLAWEVLACIHKTPSPVVLFHALSGNRFVGSLIRKKYKNIQESAYHQIYPEYKHACEELFSTRVRVQTWNESDKPWNTVLGKNGCKYLLLPVASIISF